MTARAKISLLACVCAATLAGCGSNRDATIPPANSEQMLAVLAAVERYASSGDCQLAQQQADEFKNQVVLLPAVVDDEVKQGLFDVADKLNDLTQDPSQCVDQGASGPTGLQPATQPSTTSVPATTESTTTTESSSTTTTETETPANTGGDGTTPAEPPADQAPAGGGGAGGPTSGGIGQKSAIR